MDVRIATSYDLATSYHNLVNFGDECRALEITTSCCDMFATSGSVTEQKLAYPTKYLKILYRFQCHVSDVACYLAFVVFNTAYFGC